MFRFYFLNVLTLITINVTLFIPVSPFGTFQERSSYLSTGGLAAEADLDSAPLLEYKT